MRRRGSGARLGVSPASARASGFRSSACSIEAGSFRLRGPTPGRSSSFRPSSPPSRWPELVVAGEEASARFPLWLDPHRFVAVALERMGTAFTEAREAVGRDASDFARRNAVSPRGEIRGRHARRERRDGGVARGRGASAGTSAPAARTSVATRTESSPRASRRRATSSRQAGHAEGLAIAMQLARRGSDTRERFRSSLDVARLAHERRRARGRAANPRRPRDDRVGARPRDLGSEPLRSALRRPVPVPPGRRARARRRLRRPLPPRSRRRSPRARRRLERGHDERRVRPSQPAEPSPHAGLRSARRALRRR